MAEAAVQQSSPPGNPARFFQDRVEIELTLGRVVVIDPDDYPAVSPYRWYALGGSRTIYAAARIEGVRTPMHRLLLRPTEGLLPDHKDGDGLNNRRENLRAATRFQNMQNRRINRNSTHGVKGVTRHKNGWVARIQANGKRVRLGYFGTIDLASEAYRAAAKKLHGEFSRSAE